MEPFGAFIIIFSGINLLKSDNICAIFNLIVSSDRKKASSRRAAGGERKETRYFFHGKRRGKMKQSSIFQRITRAFLSSSIAHVLYFVVDRIPWTLTYALRALSLRVQIQMTIFLFAFYWLT